MGQRSRDITSYDYIRHIRDECPELPPMARMVAWAIALRCDEAAQCWPRQQQIADDTGLTRETVNRHVQRLAAARLLIVIPRVNNHGKRANCYVLTYPQAVDKSVDKSPSDVTQNHKDVTQNHILGCDTGSHRSTYPKKYLRADAAQSVDNEAVRAVVVNLANRRRMP